MHLVFWTLPHQKSRRVIIHFAVYYLKRLTQFHSLSLFQNLSQQKNKNPSIGKKKGTEKAALLNSVAQLPQLKTSSRTDISTRTKQITETLSLKYIFWKRQKALSHLLMEKSMVCRPERRVAEISLYQDYL